MGVYDQTEGGLDKINFKKIVPVPTVPVQTKPTVQVQTKPTVKTSYNSDIWVGTWNVGDVDRAIEWIDETKDKIKAKTLIFGFQELDYPNFLKQYVDLVNQGGFDPEAPDKKLPNSAIFISTSNFIKSFKMAIVVINNESTPTQVKKKEVPVFSKKGIVAKVVKTTNFATKGALYAKISINGTPLRLVCVHLPFIPDDIDFINKQLDKIRTKLELDDTLDSSPVIMFGDFNPRSSMSLKDVKKNVSREDIKLNPNLSYMEQCTEDNKRVDRDRDEDIKEEAKRTDIFKLNKGGYSIPGFSEQDINFMPTYKFKIDDEKKGTECYLLAKEGHGRLPGYPDRIIYRGGLTPISYNIVERPGYDHFPVQAEFKFKQKVNFGARKRRSRKRARKRSKRRSRKKKSRKRRSRKKRRSKRRSRKGKSQRKARSRRHRKSKKKSTLRRHSKLKIKRNS